MPTLRMQWPNTGALSNPEAIRAWASAHQTDDVLVNLSFERRLVGMTFESICWLEVMAPTDVALDTIVSAIAGSARQIATNA
jgi:hypothetical protein